MSQETYTIKPKEGFTIPDLEHGSMLPPEGRLVNRSAFWDRRIQHGDVEVVTVKAPAPKTEK